LGAQGRSAIVTPSESIKAPDAAPLALLFAAGERPSAADVKAAAERSGEFAVTYEAPTTAGWVEALVTGLTFEVRGLAPTPACAAPQIAHRYGLADDWAPPPGCEALTIQPGEHLAGGWAMLPVVRACVALAAALTGQSRAMAVVWQPARCAMSPAYFRQLVADWLLGGAFPALGLTALAEREGKLRSEGLAFFTRQELEIERSPGQTPTADAQLAVRAIDALVAREPLTAPIRLTAPEGAPLLAEPSTDGATVRLWRQT